MIEAGDTVIGHPATQFANMCGKVEWKNPWNGTLLVAFENGRLARFPAALLRKSEG